MTANEVNADRLVADLQRVVADSEELLNGPAAGVGEKAQEMRTRLAQTLEAAKATCRRLEEQAVAGAKATDQVIRGHPYQFMGVAFGIGLLVGVLVTRK